MAGSFDELLNTRDGAVERIVPSQGIHATSLEAEHLARYRWAAKHLGAAALVLDIASGVGYGAPILGATGARKIISSDIAEAPLAYGREAFATIGVAADATSLPFADGSFDAVVSLETIEHVPRPELFLRQLHRVMKTGASLVISTPNGEETGGGNPHHLAEFSRDEFASLLSEAGFRIERRFAQQVRPLGRIWGVRGPRRVAWEMCKIRRVLADLPRFAAPLQFCWLCTREDPRLLAPYGMAEVPTNGEGDGVVPPTW